MGSVLGSHMARLHIQKVSVRLLLAIGILGMILDFYSLSDELCDIFRCFAISYKCARVQLNLEQHVQCGSS